MARVQLELPSALLQFVQDEGVIELRGETLGEGLRQLIHQRPDLARHVFDEAGALRPHVLCFHNDVNSRWVDADTVPLVDGDRIRIMQAVSGG